MIYEIYGSTKNDNYFDVGIEVFPIFESVDSVLGSVNYFVLDSFKYRMFEVMKRKEHGLIALASSKIEADLYCQRRRLKRNEK